MALPALNRFPADPIKPPPPPVERWYTALVALVNAMQAAGVTDEAAIAALQASVTFLQSVIIASGQIQFPATQNPSSNANVLDDYEEGTWTPADGSGAGLSFTVYSGSYLKIGQQVFAAAEVQWPVTANGANATVSGLPFSVQSAGDIGVVTIGLANAGLTFTGYPFAATATCGFVSNAGIRITNAQLTNAVVLFQANYRAAA